MTALLHCIARVGRPVGIGMAVLCLIASALGDTNRVYFIGNSVTDTVRYDQLRQLAEGRGNAMPWGRQMIPGSPLDNLWNSQSSGFQQPPYGYPTNALPYYTWDALSLQPFDRSLTSDTNAISNFIALSLPRNTNAQVYVYSRWPRQGNFLPDFDTTWLTNAGTTGSSYQQETREFFERVCRALREQWVTNLMHPIRIVPCGDVLYALSQKMQTGHIPGLTSIAQVYADGIHFNDTGAYTVACTFYATLYKDSPIGLNAALYGIDDTALARGIETTVWDVVRVHPYAGVIPEILPMAYSMVVPEGGTATINIKLSDPPVGVTTVNVARIAGDADITVSNGAVLVFTPANYAVWQTVTLAAAEDEDWEHGRATIACSGAGLASCNFIAIEQDNDAAAVCYDPFDVTPRIMQNLRSGYGWNSAWAVEGGSNGVGYKVVDNSLRYGCLVTKGRKAEGGYSYQGVGRSFDMVEAFQPWVFTSGGTFIGKDGTELWMSFLCRLSTTNYNGKIWFDDNAGGLYHDNNGIFRINTVYVPGQGRVWMLSAIQGSYAVTSSVPVTTNVTLMALRFQFGGDTDRVDLFANPTALGGIAPAVPDATLLVTTNRFRFADMGWNPDSGSAHGWLDEIRFGNSFANVTPTMAVIFTNNNNIVIDGIVENDACSGDTILYTGVINGTGVYVMANAVTNILIGDIRPGFSAGELVLDQGNSVLRCGAADAALTLHIENGDLLVLSNVSGPVALTNIDVTFYSSTTLGATNWFLYSTTGISGAFNDAAFVLYTTGGVVYDYANNRVGAWIVPEPLGAVCLAVLAVLCGARREACKQSS